MQQRSGTRHNGTFVARTLAPPYSISDLHVSLPDVCTQNYVSCSFFVLFFPLFFSFHFPFCNLTVVIHQLAEKYNHKDHYHNVPQGNKYAKVAQISDKFKYTFACRCFFLVTLVNKVKLRFLFWSILRT